MKQISYLNRIIEYSFYALFFLVPLIFTSATSELFELPKMWLVFGLTLLITGSWGAKMILTRQLRILRTPLDIPILLFLIANVISTIFSIDPHVSLWGYYSRFNGGLLSIISYVILYYAFVSNFNVIEKTKKSNETGLPAGALAEAGPRIVINVLKVSLLSGFLVALWGIPSHFGYDPTCFIFRQSFDTSCWTDAFKPTIRIFSTLGQPAWLAAYLSILIPIIFAIAMINSNIKNRNSKQTQNKNNQYSKSYKDLDLENSKLFQLPVFGFRFYYILALLLYAALVYTDTRGGFIGFWIANVFFWFIIFWKKLLSSESFKKYFLIFNLTFLIFNFLQGLPVSQLDKFTLPAIVKNAAPIPVNNAANSPTPPPAAALGGTDSGKIRLFVWRGALDAWQDKPIIGHGVETFAYAYYANKPIGHNLTSEWDYLYNKAHNEYLNYLATTGILGLGSYLAIIGVFIYKALLNGYMARWLKINHSTIQPSNHKLDNHEKTTSHLLAIGLISGYFSILISNFFGFSVVIINLYFFLIPAFVFVLGDYLSPNKAIVFPRAKPMLTQKPTRNQYLFLAAILIAFCFLLFALVNRLRADISYANGQTLNNAGAYQDAYPFLVQAISLAPNEPVYRDELSTNMGTLAAALYLQNEASNAAEIKDQAVILSDSVVGQHPANIVYWKSRVRLFYTLAQGDPDNENEYLNEALIAINKSRKLAPTDAKITYNLGILQGQRGETAEAISTLEEAVRLKPDYRDAYYALALFYDESGNHTKAIESLQYILVNINPEDEIAQNTLDDWE